MTKTIVCFGAGPIFKGGMADYNTALAKALADQNLNVHLVSWSQQYPGLIPRQFKDKISTLTFLENSTIKCKYITNYNNPCSWNRTAEYIAMLKPTKVIIQWSIAIQGLPINQIIKRLKKISACEIIVDLHFVIQKEQSKIDRFLTKMGIAGADTYLVHALKTYRELQALFPSKRFTLTETGQRNLKSKTSAVLKLFHPVYDLYEPKPDFDVQGFKNQLKLRKYVFLFFGFIREYKGLHNAIKAFDLVSKTRDDVSFLICGELFWNTLQSGGLMTRFKQSAFAIAKKILDVKSEDQHYNPLKLIDTLNLSAKTKLINTFIPNEAVHRYFQVADATVLFYSRATPSGIESLSYNFNLPILATRVGHFPETIQAGQNGYMTQANTVAAMAETMHKFLEHPILPQQVAHFKTELTWAKYAAAIMKV